MNCTSENGSGGATAGHAISLSSQQPLMAQLFAASGAVSWGTQPDAFVAALERSARKRFCGESPTAAQLQSYLSSLHLQDLALACACAEGHSAAWDSFVSTYRGYLRSAASAILRCPAESPVSCELADSLFADLYGLATGENRRSLFRYFHGRSSLKTWLRAVLAQRHVDSIRAGRRFTDLGDADSQEHSPGPRLAAVGSLSAAGSATFPDPHRPALVARFRRTLEVALALLDSRDKERLRLYYAAEQTLAEIGRILGEHESSVSRNLERTRRALRQQVEQSLRKGGAGADGTQVSPGLSDEQITLCFQYVSEDAPIDLDKLLPENPPSTFRPQGKKL
jgi:RNA polymerase sigma factor (sigma-70 family)